MTDHTHAALSQPLQMPCQVLHHPLPRNFPPQDRRRIGRPMKYTLRSAPTCTPSLQRLLSQCWMQSCRTPSVNGLSRALIHSTQDVMSLSLCLPLESIVLLLLKECWPRIRFNRKKRTLCDVATGRAAEPIFGLCMNA